MTPTDPKNFLLRFAMDWMLRPVPFRSEEKRDRVVGQLVQAVQDPEVIARARAGFAAAFEDMNKGSMLAFRMAEVLLLMTLVPDAMPTRDLPPLQELAHRCAVVDLRDRMVLVMTTPRSTDCRIILHLADLTR